MTHPCPPAEQLQQLATGVLPDPPASDVESHVLACQDCQKVTASFKLGDTFVGQVRDAAKKAEGAAALDPADRQRVERIIVEASGVRSGSALFESFKSGDTLALSNNELRDELPQMLRPPQSPDELGRLAAFRVLKVLGVGGMGCVFLAEDMELRRHVALKVMRPHAAAMRGAAERFLREAQAAAAIKHDNVVTIYRVGQDRNVPFIAQELLIGESLEDRLARDSHVPVPEAIAIVRQIAAGLAAAHVRGVTHRDVKPANVWLEPDVAAASPRVKLLDFGLARSYEDAAQLTQSGMILGTAGYMAPEQAAGRNIDARADLFSLGVVLYRMLTGDSPFDRADLMGTLTALAIETPRPPSSVMPSIPESLSSLVMGLLEKKPTNRPSSALEVAQTLGGIAKNLDSATQLQLPATPQPGSLEVVKVRDDRVQAKSQNSVANGLLETGETQKRKLFVALSLRAWFLQLSFIVGKRGRRVFISLALGGMAAAAAFGAVVIMQQRNGKELAQSGEFPWFEFVPQREIAEAPPATTGEVHLHTGHGGPVIVGGHHEATTQEAEHGITGTATKYNTESLEKTTGSPTTTNGEADKGTDATKKKNDETPPANTVDPVTNAGPAVTTPPDDGVKSKSNGRLLRIRDKMADAAERIFKALTNSSSNPTTREQESSQTSSDQPRPSGSAVPDISSPGTPPIPPIAGSPPRSVPKTERLSPLALVTSPAPIAGLKRWTIETVAARGYCANNRPFALNRSGSHLALADESSTLRIFDTTTQGRLERALVLPSRAFSVDWSPDEKLLAAVGPDTLCVIEPLSGRLLYSETGSFRKWRTDLAWSADSEWLAVSGDVLRVWNRKRAEMSIVRNLGGAPDTLAWSPSFHSRLLAVTCTDDKVRFYDQDSQQVAFTLDGSPAAALHDIGLAWSPDGNRLLTSGLEAHPALGHADDHGLCLWDMPTPKNATMREPIAKPFPVEVDGCHLTWSPDNKWLASTGAETAFVELGNAQVSRATGFYHQNEIIHQCWSPDGRKIYRAPRYFGAGNICLDAVDVASRRRVAQWAGFTAASDFLGGLAPDRTRILSVFRSAVNGTDLETGASVVTTNESAEAAFWSATGQYSAVSSFDNAGRSVVSLYDRSFSQPIVLTANSVAAISPDGRQVAFKSSKDPMAFEIWNCEKGTRDAVFPGATSDIVRLQWSPSGHYIAAEHANKTVAMWSPTRPDAPISVVDARGSESMHWAVASETFLIVLDKSLRIVGPRAGSGGRTVRTAAPVASGDYDAQNQRLTYLTTDGKLWQTIGDDLGSHLIGQTQPCDSARFLPGGQLATNRRGDSAVFLWDAQTAEPRTVIVPFTNEHHVVISPDGHIRGKRGIEQHLVYIIETDAGQQTLSAEEFARRFNWKNDPRNVEL